MRSKGFFKCTLSVVLMLTAMIFLFAAVGQGADYKIIKIGEPSNRALGFLRTLEKSSYSENCTPNSQVVVVNLINTLSKDDHQQLAESIAQDDTVVFIENAKEDSIPDSALFATDSDLLIIKSSHGGRIQHVLVVGTKEQLNLKPKERPNAELPAKKNSTKTVHEEKKEEKAENDERTVDAVFNSKLENVINWLDTPKILQSRRDVQQINASLIRGSITIERAKNYKTPICGTAASLFYSYDVEVAAVVEPKKNKIVKITSVGSYVSITNGLTVNNKDYRGDGTYMGIMLLYPGDRATFDKSEVELPQGWRIIKIAPETPNSENQYTRTTGYTIGAEGSGEISDKPKVAAKLSVSYSSSKSYSETFLDFTALNVSNSAYCEWRYVYTKVYKNWEDIFSPVIADIEDFPLLAQSTMYMKNEVVYEAPASDNSKQKFYNFIGHEILYAHSRWWKGYGIEWPYADWQWDNFTINLGSVIFPSES